MSKSQKVRDLEGYLPGLVEQVVEEHAEELLGSQKMLRSKAQLSRLKDNVFNRLSLNHYKDEIALVFRIIHKYLESVTTSEEAAQVFEELKNSEVSVKRFYESEEQKEVFVPYREILGYSEETMKCCYRLGVAAFNKKEYFYAHKLFIFLLLLSPGVPTFWCATGISLKRLEEYEKALHYFEKAKTLFPEEPSLYIHSAHCFIELGKHLRAKDALSQAGRYLGESEKKVWAESIQNLKELIKQKGR